MRTLASDIAQIRNEFEKGKQEESLARLHALVDADPARADAWHLLGTLTARRGQILQDQAVFPRATTYIAKAVELDPRETWYRESLINFLAIQKRVDEALEQARDLLRVFPDSPGAHLSLAGCLHEALQPAEAHAILETAQARFPDDLGIAGILASFANYDADMPALERARRHFAYGELLARLSSDTPAKLTNDPDPERKLRVGFISGDFRLHSCSFFFEPLLANLDRSKIDPYLYYTYTMEDPVTARYRAMAKKFVRLPPNVPGVTEGFGFKLWNDKIDVLIDLSGHTSGHRLNVMHGRPVPVQATYLGYPATTGVKAVDYRIVDSITDPPGSERFCVEQLWRLDPCFLCYKPLSNAPEPTPRAAGEPPVFGSFNNTLKLNDRTVRLWARVLLATPRSKLLLKNSSVTQPAFKPMIEGKFSALGVSPDRLILTAGQDGMRDHLTWYGKLDVGLDPLAYNGTTTTCEALWMGVPVVALAGECHAERVGASLLSVVGLRDLVATSEDDYVRIASGLVRDRARLDSLRGTLRPTMAASPLCDAPGFARRFEEAIRAMWRRWCESRRNHPA